MGNLSLPQMPVRYWILAVFTVAMVIFIVAPLVVVILNSFSSVAYNVFPPEGYSFRWYENLAAQKPFYLATLRSLLLATLTTILALIIGTMAAYALVRYRLPGIDFIKAFLLSPIVMPKIVLGVALFMFFVQIKVFGHYSSLLLTHTLVSVPFVIAINSAALMNFDWSTQEAAMDLGAGPIRTFFLVIFPQISISVWISGVLAFITSFDQVETTIFLVRPGDHTLPIEMFIYLQKWQDPTIAALSTVLILFALGVVFVLSRVLRGRRLPVDLLKHDQEGKA